ncbi:MAG: DUF4387 domain-containing protein [Granulosicoccus sp.]|nr:DUF4387 domain-containing protein [Granulosicoccus sp.]
MTVTVASLAKQVRAKNAGPFWISIDVFCDQETSYAILSKQITTDMVAKALQQPAESIQRFDIPSLKVIKFSLPRPVVQGHRRDRDMHGAQWAILLEELTIDA